MSTLTPPVQLEHPENQFRVDYIQDYASSKFELSLISWQIEIEHFAKTVSY